MTKEVPLGGGEGRTDRSDQGRPETTGTIRVQVGRSIRDL